MTWSNRGCQPLVPSIKSRCHFCSRVPSVFNAICNIHSRLTITSILMVIIVKLKYIISLYSLLSIMGLNFLPPLVHSFHLEYQCPANVPTLTTYRGVSEALVLGHM